jgi:glutamate-1-semialdehyde 2,1-aminomutase
MWSGMFSNISCLIFSFTWEKTLELQRSQPQLFEANRDLIRNEGATMGTGQKLWKRAKQVIPGGNMLLSKRAEMFLPGQWPSYFSKARGCRVWDLDGREFIDMSIMGIGTNILGYGPSRGGRSGVEDNRCRQYVHP